MTERAIEITQSYTPGKNLGRTRTITVERVPATEVTYDGGVATHITFAVSERIDVLISAAFAANDLTAQRISFTPGIPRASRSAFARKRARGEAVR